jgi:SpoVK/Ycf46/Vps4 family AAA+-type ATPase
MIITNLKKDILDSFEKIFETTKAKVFNEKLLNDNSQEIKTICDYFNCTDIQAAFISIIFVISCKDGYATNQEIHEHFNSSAMLLMRYNDDIEELKESGILKYTLHPKGRYRKSYVNEEVYIVPDKITQAILNNEALPKLKNDNCNSIFELLETLEKIREEAENGELNGESLLRENQRFIHTNKKFKLIENILNYKLSDIDNFIYFDLVWNKINGIQTIDIETCIDLIYEEKSKKISYVQQLLNEDNKLLINDLIEIEGKDYFNGTRLKLSEKSLNIMQECGIKMDVKTKQSKYIIRPENIKSKKLIYNKKEAEELEMLSSFIKEKKFKELQKSLKAKNLIPGITALFYGEPGTGKTESVLQLARKSKRELLNIDMSRTKSMWFGESEKIVRQLFDDYREYTKRCDKTPILFFNEADGVISKRKDVESSNVSQTENAIQNIILEELERFEGIFFATTNLLQNIDKAFERRFLFKIEFCKPDKDSSAKIWKAKFPYLKIKQCIQLSEQYNFSGGELENILRKTEMQQLLNNEQVCIEKIKEFCNAERWDRRERSRVGF